jgi:peptide/nickel transport system substrate-binding protein
MKRFYVLLAIVLLSIIVFTGCAKETTETPTTSAPATSGPATTTPSADQPQYGGTLRMIMQTGPANVGEQTSMSFNDMTRAVLWVERLMTNDQNGNLEPCLAESWTSDTGANTITFNLRKGVKFHDGTTFNAEAARWNIQQMIDAKTLPDSSNIKSIDILDEYTMRINLNKYTYKMLYSLWRPMIFSPTAYQQNGKDWCIQHAVATGPFKVTEFQQDVITKLEKFDDYWREGRPYLDGIEMQVVKETATASAMIQSGQADFWYGATTKEAADLRDMGYNVKYLTSTIGLLCPDSKDPGSPLADVKVRMAVEYALDRDAMVAALGYGFAEAMTQPAPTTGPGFDPSFTARDYDPDKARQLLKEAGYPDGFATTLDMMTTAQETGVVIKNFLEEVGIKVTLDPADMGRFWGMQFSDGWKGLHLSMVAINGAFAVGYLDHFGPEAVVSFASLYKSPEFLETCNQVLATTDYDSMRAKTKQMIRQTCDDAMVIPTFTNNDIIVTQKNVHTTFLSKYDHDGWDIWDDWMSK